MVRKLWHKKKKIEATVQDLEFYLNSLLKLPEKKKVTFQSRPALLHLLDTSSNKCILNIRKDITRFIKFFYCQTGFMSFLKCFFFFNWNNLF